MKYVCIDIETTGLDPIKNDILEIGMIVEDTNKKIGFDDAPKLRFWLDKEYYRGNPYALVENVEILKKIVELRRETSRRLVKPDDASLRITNFLRQHFAENGVFKGKIVVAGKNYSAFDKQFLIRLKDYEDIPFSHRTLDPGTIFMDWKKDVIPPGLTECKQRAGVAGPVKHDTLSDAWDVIQVLRTRY